MTVVWIAKPFVLKSFVFSFFVPVWNSLLNLWLFFMSFVATSSYVIVSRPCRLSESYLNRASIVWQKDESKPQQAFWWHYGCIGQKNITAKQGKLCEHQKYFWNFIVFRAVARKKLQPRRTHGPLYEISRMKSSNIISLIKKIKIDSIW